jgi:hypothetical protein
MGKKKFRNMINEGGVNGILIRPRVLAEAKDAVLEEDSDEYEEEEEFVQLKTKKEVNFPVEIAREVLEDPGVPLSDIDLVLKAVLKQQSNIREALEFLKVQGVKMPETLLDALDLNMVSTPRYQNIDLPLNSERGGLRTVEPPRVIQEEAQLRTEKRAEELAKADELKVMKKELSLYVQNQMNNMVALRDSPLYQQIVTDFLESQKLLTGLNTELKKTNIQVTELTELTEAEKRVKKSATNKRRYERKKQLRDVRNARANSSNGQDLGDQSSGISAGTSSSSLGRPVRSDIQLENAIVKRVVAALQEMQSVVSAQ